MKSRETCRVCESDVKAHALMCRRCGSFDPGGEGTAKEHPRATIFYVVPLILSWIFFIIQMDC